MMTLTMNGKIRFIQMWNIQHAKKMVASSLKKTDGIDFQKGQYCE